MQKEVSHAPAQADDAAAPLQISKNRAAYRLEMRKPEMKWKMFEEQCRKEQRERERLERKPEIRKEPSKVVQTVLKRLRYMTDQHVKRQGGRASSILHGAFLHWDHNNSGMLNTQNLMGALSQVGVPISRPEAEEVIAHYSDEDPSGAEPRELAHNELLRDAAQGAPGLLEVDPTVTKRLLGSSRSEGCLLGTSKTPRQATYVVRAFRTKLQQVIDARVRDKGGSPSRILLGLFRNWDLEHSGTLNTAQLRGALRSFNMRLSTDQAKELLRFYATDGNPDGGCDYRALVQDVCGYDLGPFVHKAEQAALSKRAYDSGRDSESSGASLQFTARPHEKPSNRVVERFKLRLRDALENRIKHKGGVTHAIIREAFLNWDADSSGKLDPAELVGALKHMGVAMTDSEAKAAVNYYDLDGSGAMDYNLLCREIKAMSHPVLSYIEEVDVLNGLEHTVREPAVVSRVLETIRRGVSAVGQRAAGSPSCVSLISPENLLAGTCLRYDTSDRGALGIEELRQVWKQLKIRLRVSETTALVSWLDRSATKTVQHSDLCNAVFGRDNSSSNNSSNSSPGSSRALKSGSMSSRPKDQPPPPLLPLPPPAPHKLQARRALAMSMGDSCSIITASGRNQACPALPGRKNKKDAQRRQQHGGGGSGAPTSASRRKRQHIAPYFENKAAWNWQGRALPKEVAGEKGERDKLDGGSGGGDGGGGGGGGGGSGGGGGAGSGAGAPAAQEPGRVVRRCGSAGVPSGSGGMRGGVLKAGGEAIVAEKTRIEKRLKELHKERTNVLRQKKWVECWADDRAGNRNRNRNNSSINSACAS